ncbi:hypothetical protein IV203_010892 [Nitzschia inconspicua]|uniref:Uncharacterized protein n=1 Tax=Nitzschia inconspicua TaxID=303405 RepID=A0A9K3KXZ5_9STRA|nr:hypothetical protein IV203_010892 [Nitzschia inconspicua]
MVNQETILKVRNLVNGRVNGDRIQGSAWFQDAAAGRVTDQSQDTRQGSGSSWIEDSNGRITDFSQDDPYLVGNENSGLISQTEQVLVPNNRPVIEYAQSMPRYPIAFSCEHILLLPRDSMGFPRTDNRYDFFAPIPQVAPLLNEINVPITLQVLLPESVEGKSLTSDMVVLNVDAMEWSLLNLVAGTTGLSSNCNINMQYNHRLLQQHSSRSLRQQRIVDAAPSAPSRRLGSLPYPTGIYQVATDRDSTKWKGKCAVEYDRSKENCFTIHTEMKIKYRGGKQESNLVQEYVQSIVQNQVSEDPSQLFAMNVIGLHWGIESESSTDVFVDIGDFHNGNDNKPFNPTTHEDPTTNSSTLSILSPQILIPFCTGIVLLLLWVVIHIYTRKKLRQHSKTASVSEASKERKGDLESGSVATAPTISPSYSGNDISGDFGTPETKPVTPLEKKPSGLLRDKPIKRSYPVSVDSPERKPLPVSVDSPDRSAAGLPPRPPRRGTIKLKHNRKKKKRKNKKIASLKRVNSREGINEMPMISESDEDSEIGSEGDSEYTSDDGSSIDASSGCLTPARSSSLSRKSSRASSPQLSPREELFSSEPFDQDVKFVIEAPDFPNLLNSKEQEGRTEVPATSLQSNHTFTSDQLANRLKQEFSKLEIEPRAPDESMESDCDSPSRKLPLPWLT